MGAAVGAKRSLTVISQFDSMYCRWQNGVIPVIDVLPDGDILWATYDTEVAVRFGIVSIEGHQAKYFCIAAKRDIIDDWRGTYKIRWLVI